MPAFAGMTAEQDETSNKQEVRQKMSVVEILHQAHKARQKRMSARTVRQHGTPSQILPAMPGIDLNAKHIRSRYSLDRDYERAWAVEIMGLVERDGRPRRPRIVDIQRAIAQQFDIPLNELLADRRTRTPAAARHAAMYLARQLTVRSFAEIGRAFAGRDHSTVVHAVKGIEARLPFDGELAHRIARVRDELKKTFVLSEGRTQD
jgi:hypothetical protein